MFYYSIGTVKGTWSKQWYPHIFQGLPFEYTFECVTIHARDESVQSAPLEELASQAHKPSATGATTSASTSALHV